MNLTLIGSSDHIGKRLWLTFHCWNRGHRLAASGNYDGKAVCTTCHPELYQPAPSEGGR